MSHWYRLLAACAALALTPHPARAEASPPSPPSPATPVEFDSAFIRGGAQVDLSRFSRGNPVLPGEYTVDLLINGQWKGHATVRFVAQPNSDIAQPCIDHTVIGLIGLDFEKLTDSARTQLQKVRDGGCFDLAAAVPDATVSFDLSQLRLEVSVPQVAVLHRPRGYVSPEFWDRGVTSATLGYNLNAYRSTSSEFTSSHGHLDLSLGANYGTWHLRERSFLDVESRKPANFQSIATYVAHDMPAIRSDLTIGDSFTDGAVFDSYGFRGVSLASDDLMLPDSQLEYAPIVHGIARTNARVVVTQNGNTILETTVSPGSFEINDLYATGYGGDLHVTVYEADGSQTSFVVPYTSLVQLLRPGVWRYSLVAGEVNQPSLTGTERFVQGALQHGFNSYLTGYTGGLSAQHYRAGLVGIALNTPVGALALDITTARANIIEGDSSAGESVRLSYSRLFSRTHTNLTVATYRYSSNGYYSFADAQSAVGAVSAGTDPAAIQRARGQLQININQTLPGKRGNFFVTASVRDYWNTSGTTTDLQAGYSNRWRIFGANLSYSISASRQKDILTGRPDRQVQASFSVPLGASPHAPLFSARYLQDTLGAQQKRSEQAVIDGTLGANNQVNYSASSIKSAGEDSFAASSQYRSRYANVSASIGSGSGYSQQSAGVTGGVVVHPGGVTFGNQMTDTIGIVEAIGAEGARVTNNVGTTINHAGYAVLPFLMPYRLNSINIDPDDAVSSEIEFKSTSESVAPRANSVVMIHFQTVGGRAILMSVHLLDGAAVPFGASVFDSQGSEVGLAGQDGGVYLRGIADSGTLTARWGEAPDEQCSFKYQLPPKSKDDGPIVRLDASCRVNPDGPRQYDNDGRPDLLKTIGQNTELKKP